MDEHEFEAESPLFRMTLDDDGFSLRINEGEKKIIKKLASVVSATPKTTAINRSEMRGVL